MIGHLSNGVFHPKQTKLVLVLELSPHQGLWGLRHPGPHSEDAKAQCGDAVCHPLRVQYTGGRGPQCFYSWPVDCSASQLLHPLHPKVSQVKKLQYPGPSPVGMTTIHLRKSPSHHLMFPLSLGSQPSHVRCITLAMSGSLADSLAIVPAWVWHPTEY